MVKYAYVIAHNSNPLYLSSNLLTGYKFLRTYVPPALHSELPSYPSVHRSMGKGTAQRKITTSMGLITVTKYVLHQQFPPKGQKLGAVIPMALQEEPFAGPKDDEYI